MIPPVARRCAQPFTTREAGVAALANASKRTELEFVESLAFSASDSVVMTGTMVDAPADDGRVNKIGKWWKPWFFAHVQTHLDGFKTSAEQGVAGTYFAAMCVSRHTWVPWHFSRCPAGCLFVCSQRCRSWRCRRRVHPAR